MTAKPFVINPLIGVSLKFRDAVSEFFVRKNKKGEA